MRGCSLLRTFVFLLLSAAVSFPQDRPDARDLLSRADAAIFTSKTVRLAATHSQGFVGSESPGSPFKIEFVRGGRGRAEYKFPVGDGTITLIVFDGTYLWEYHNSGQSVHQEARVRLDVSGRNRNHRLRTPFRLMSWLLLIRKMKRLFFAASPVDCYVLLAKYSHAPSLPMAGDAMRRVWISKTPN